MNLGINRMRNSFIGPLGIKPGIDLQTHYELTKLEEQLSWLGSPAVGDVRSVFAAG